MLFFSRLLADVCGRTVPRVKVLAVYSPMTLFALGCFMTASIPGYLYYIKALPWHSDWAITGADPYDPPTYDDHYSYTPVDFGSTHYRAVSLADGTCRPIVTPVWGRRVRCHVCAHDMTVCMQHTL